MITDSNEERKVLVSKGITTALGVTIYQEGINFAVSVKEGIVCRFLLYSYGSSEPILDYTFDKENKIGDIHTIFVKNLSQLKYEYIYMLNNDIYLDPYARILTGREEWGKVVNKLNLRCGFDLEAFDWEGDKPLRIPYHQVIMYSLHVRGFTMHPSSKVRHKGTFEGIIEKIPYLKELGVNQIELMPAYEFDEIIPRRENNMEFTKYLPDQQYTINYWGYTKANYFAPKASYTSGDDSAKAFKSMVKELHKNNIEVIMEFNFDDDVNQNIMVDCVKYWVEEYHIDGVHINSNGVPTTLLATMPRLSNTKIMSEDFDFRRIYKEERYPLYKNLAQYNDGFLIDARRFLKGDENILNSFTNRMRKNPKHCGVINYIASHNGFNLMDLVSYDVKHNETNGENNKDGTDYNYSWNCGVEGPTRKKSILRLRKQQIKNAYLLFLFSQGVPKINSGDEFGHTQMGNNNPYCQDNEISWIDWNKIIKQKELFEYIKTLILFRNEHPILHKSNELKIMDYLGCGYPDLSYHGEKAWYPDFDNESKQIGIMYCGKYELKENKKEDDFIYLAFNMNWEAKNFSLPSLPPNKKWRIALDTSQEVAMEKVITIQKNLNVKERSIVVLIGK